MSAAQKRLFISPSHQISVQLQCELLGLSRSSFYYKSTDDEVDTILMNEIMDVWTAHPSFGYRRVTAYLRESGFDVNRKRVQRLMVQMGLRSILPKPRFNTSIANKENPVRPYLLRGITIDCPNQVWATDITYIKLPGGMVYLFALIDWHTRYVVSWKLATTMESEHAIEFLHEAVSRYGCPEIDNSDQGSQYTSLEWIAVAESYGIEVSHDGVGPYA